MWIVLRTVFSRLIYVFNPLGQERSNEVVCVLVPNCNITIHDPSGKPVLQQVHENFEYINGGLRQRGYEVCKTTAFRLNTSRYASRHLCRLSVTAHSQWYLTSTFV